MSYNPFSLAGKTILITGASSGIGQGTAVECSRMGAKLIITGRNAERLAATMAQLEGDGHVMITADISNDDDIARLVAECPKLQGVFLCAGIGVTAPVAFCSRKKFEEQFAVNLFSTTELARMLIKKKKLDRPSSVVAVASVAALLSHLNNSMYGASKAALLTWMRYAAKELGPKGIRFNCILPGMVETPLIRGGAITDEQLAEEVKNYPLGRFGEPADIAYAAIYLLSDASAWVTGTDIIVDGGSHM